jgi:hypothetical protein
MKWGGRRLAVCGGAASDYPNPTQPNPTKTKPTPAFYSISEFTSIP